MNNELYHHGILGQKWGVRRYQNKDGTLTAAGKKRKGYSKKYYENTKDTIKKYEETNNVKSSAQGTKFITDLKRESDTRKATVKTGIGLGAIYGSSWGAAAALAAIPGAALAAPITILAGSAATIAVGANAIRRSVIRNRAINDIQNEAIVNENKKK